MKMTKNTQDKNSKGESQGNYNETDHSAVKMIARDMCIDILVEVGDIEEVAIDKVNKVTDEKISDYLDYLIKYQCKKESECPKCRTYRDMAHVDLLGVYYSECPTCLSNQKLLKRLKLIVSEKMDLQQSFMFLTIAEADDFRGMTLYDDFAGNSAKYTPEEIESYRKKSGISATQGLHNPSSRILPIRFSSIFLGISGECSVETFSFIKKEIAQF